MKKNSLCGCQVGIGCGTLRSCLKKEKVIKNLSTHGERSVDLPPGKRPVHFWFGEVGMARENSYGRPLAPSQTAQVAFWRDVSVEQSQKAETEIGVQDGACGRQTALREDFSYVLPCETQDSRFSSPSEALAVAFLRQWRAQCISCCKRCWHWLQLWMSAGARLIILDLCLRSSVLPLVSAYSVKFVLAHPGAWVA